jgi:hypothetical protein
MAARDDDDNEERVARTAKRYAAEQAFFDAKDAKAAREKSARDSAAAEAEAAAGVAVARARQASAAPRSRTKYEGPDPDRASRGNFVSKEELADFQRKNPGATLRDLLNADRGLTRRGSPPPPQARAEVPALFKSSKTAPEDAMARIAGRQPSKSPEEERDEAKNRTMAALSLLGGAGANVGLRALAGRMGAGRAAPAPASRGPLVKDDDIIPAFKKGGKVKAYAKGGSVKGSGCEQRGLRKCKVY